MSLQYNAALDGLRAIAVLAVVAFHLCDFRQYRDRNRIERMFNRLKQFRRIATRYDKTAKSFLAFLHLAAARLWLPTFVNRA
jgi:transposase